MLGSGLWAATILDRILAAVGSPFGIDTSGMSSLAAAAAVAFAIYSWYSKIKPKPGPTPTPEPQPSPAPQPLPSPTPSPSPQPVDIGQLLQVLLPELAKVLDGLLKKRLAEVPQLGPETIVDDDDEEVLQVFGAREQPRVRTAALGIARDLSERLAFVHREINQLAEAARAGDPVAMNPATAIAILNALASIWPIIKVVMAWRGVKLPDAPLQQISLASLPVASEGGK
jgi:hypothetical protein